MTHRKRKKGHKPYAADIGIDAGQMYRGIHLKPLRQLLRVVFADLAFAGEGHGGVGLAADDVAEVGGGHAVSVEEGLEGFKRGRGGSGRNRISWLRFRRAPTCSPGR
jgi:hypothetical protein